MNLRPLREHLQSLHAVKPQDVAHIDLAVAQVESGLQALSRLGHLYHLVDGPGEPELWPRLFFCISGQETLVHSRDELISLGPGWHPTLGEAQLAAGRARQFRDRGGVRTTDFKLLSFDSTTRVGQS